MNIKSSNGVVAIAVFFFYIITAFFLSFSFAHINVFFLKKVSKYHWVYVCSWYIMIYKMRLLNMFTKKYHGSIMNSIEVS